MPTALASLLSAALVATHAAALGAADAGGTWVQLTPAGTFSGRNGLGPYTTGDKAAMDKIVANTLALAGSSELVVDYDHQAVFAAVPGVGGRAPAAGWIKQLQARDDGIYGRVEWTEAAATAIKAGEYRYLSPVFLHDKAGKVLVIRMAGLTNTPNLDMVAVAASALIPQTTQPGDSMDKILAALGLAKGTNEDGVVAAINAHLTSTTAIAKAAGLTEAARAYSGAEILTAVNALAADRAKLAKAAGLKDDAKTDEIVTAVQSAVAAGNPDPTKFVPVAQVTALQNDLKTLREDLTKDKAEEAVNSAIKDGKLAPALKDWGLSLFKADAKQFETFVGSAPVLTRQQIESPKREGHQGETLDETQLAVCTAMGITPEAFKKTLAAEAAEQEKSR